MKRTIPVLMSIFFLFAATMIFAAVGSSAADQAKGTDVKSAKAIFEDTCSQCHSLSRPLGKKKDKTGWEETVSRMSSYHARRLGGPIPEKDQSAIVEYLLSVAGK